MLGFSGQPRRHCDRVTRRHFLVAGSLGIGTVSLADLLRAEAAAGIRHSDKAIINIHLDGGPPQMDMIDPKPAAPAEIRGEFAPISSAIPGLRVSQLLPAIAKSAGDFVFMRSLTGAEGRHDAFQCHSGFAARDLKSIGGRPALGCVIGKLTGPVKEAPVFVDLMQGRPLVRNSARPGFLGPSYQPFRPNISHLFSRPLEDGMKKELAALGADHTSNLELHASLDANRLQARSSLLGQLDQIRQRIDQTDMMDALDRFQQQAAGILTSGRLARALDLGSEDPLTVDRYVAAPTGSKGSSTSENERAMLKLLMARRLIQAGVRCVSVSFSDFDTHTANFQRLRHLGPIFDHGLCALVDDLRQRDMLDNVLIVAWGEFGRTPKVNSKAGRDHWPRVAMGMLAGGGLKSGQVIGATDRWASEATERPVHYKDVVATIYHHLGINPHSTTIVDPTGRPQYLLDHGQTIHEVV